MKELREERWKTNERMLILLRQRFSLNSSLNAIYL